MTGTENRDGVISVEEKLDEITCSKTKAYALLKPDAVREGYVPTIIQILTDNGFHVLNLKGLRFQERMRKNYMRMTCKNY